MNAKNCLVNVHGFSPYQIVYGRNPYSPSNINKPSALEDKTIGEVMKRHFTNLQEAQKSYLAAEPSERIQRVFRKQIRPKEEFQDEKVFFLMDVEWKGPGWIIGKDNVVVIVRYGGIYVHVHESRLLRALKSKALYNNKTDNIESEGEENTDAAGNGTVEQ